MKLKFADDFMLFADFFLFKNKNQTSLHKN